MDDKTSSRKVPFDPALTPHEQLMLQHEQLVREMAEGNGPSDETDSGAGPQGEVDESVIHDRVVDALRTIYDPEIPVNIYDLGLIYRVEVKGRFVAVDMTLTAPGCPVAQTFPGMVEGTVRLVPGVEDAVVELVWDPPWRQDMISEAARLELGLI